MKFTEGQIRAYEDIMQQIPNYQTGGGKRKNKFTYTLEDCKCEYCLYCVKNKCLAVKCVLEEVLDCIAI